MALYKKFFEIVPMNNINEFNATSGVNIIQFLIPAVNGATLSTQDLMLSGTLQVNTDTSTPYTDADFGDDGISMDSVIIFAVSEGTSSMTREKAPASSNALAWSISTSAAFCVRPCTLYPPCWYID